MGNMTLNQKAALKKRFRDFKRRHRITDKEIAAAFNYSSVDSFRNAARHYHIINGLLQIADMESAMTKAEATAA